LLKKGTSKGPANLEVYLLSWTFRSEKTGLAKGPVLLVCAAGALRTYKSSISVHFKVVFDYLEPKMCKFLFSFFKSND